MEGQGAGMGGGWRGRSGKGWKVERKGWEWVEGGGE